MTRRHPTGALALACLLLTGCGTQDFRAETVLHSDGRVERAIYQPDSETPSEAAASERWRHVMPAEHIPPEQWTRSIRDLPAAEPGQKRPYVAAWGNFDSVDEVPPHFVRKSPIQGRAGTLRQAVRRVDYVLVIEHRWEEMLTDVVSLDDLQAARSEAADLAVAVLEDVLTEAYAANHDISALTRWLRDEGIAWFGELVDVYVDVLARRPAGHETVLRRRFEEVCGRRGLKSLDDKAVAAFAADKLRTLIRQRDGSPPDETLVTEVLGWLGLQEFRNAQGQTAPSPLEATAERMIQEKHGGREAFEQQAADLFVRIVGVYGPLTPRARFDYSLTMPGIVVETSGALHSDDRVQWRFEASQAYPFGYRMTCRALEPNDELQLRLLKERPLASRADLIDFVEIVSSHEGLRNTLQRCVAAGSLAPLHDFHDQARLAEDAKALTVIRRLWKVLKLPV